MCLVLILIQGNKKRCVLRELCVAPILWLEICRNVFIES